MALKKPLLIRVENDTDSAPDGYISYSYANLGINDATLTFDGTVFTLPAGSVFNLSNVAGNDGWYGATIDASSTIVECSYY